MLKILQASLQHYVNQELPDVQTGFQSSRGTKGQIANISWITEKAREFQKNTYFTDYAKAFDCVDHNKLWKVLKEMGVPDPLLISWENCMQVKKQRLEPDVGQQTGSKLGKIYDKADYFTSMWNAGLDESQARIKIARRNINNLRYTDDTTPMQKVKRN